MNDRPTLVLAYPAQISCLPDGCYPRHGFLIVTVKHWSDGTVSAELPVADVKTGRLTLGDGPQDYTEADVLTHLSQAIADRVKEIDSPGFGRKVLPYLANNLRALVERGPAIQSSPI